MALRGKDYKDKDKLLSTRNAQRKRYYKQTQGHPPRRWEEWEIKLIEVEELADRDIAVLLKRSVQAIQLKRYKLKRH